MIFAGVVVDVFPGDGDHDRLKPGDEAFGMAHPDRGATWAEYTVVHRDEIALKPKKFTWEQAAAVPLSALTAYQALFDWAGVPVPDVSTSQKEAVQQQ